jgi:hypothetical protein
LIPQMVALPIKPAPPVTMVIPFLISCIGEFY